MLTKQFWFGDTGILVRSIRTFAQTSIAMIGVGTTSLFSVDFKAVMGTAGLAALLSALMSLDRSTAATAAVTGAPAEVTAPTDAILPTPPRRRPPVTEPTFQPPGLGCGSVR